MLLGFITLGFLLILLAAKILTVLEIRSLTHQHLRNQNRIAELEADLDTSRRRYLIALKSEGVARNKVSQLKMRYASARQHLDQLEATAVQQEAQQQREKEGKLEALVMQALGGTSVRRDSHFKNVMTVIRQVIDLDKHTNAEELMVAIQGKLAEMGRKGIQTSTASPSPVAPEVPGTGTALPSTETAAPAKPAAPGHET